MNPYGLRSGIGLGAAMWAIILLACGAVWASPACDTAALILGAVAVVALWR